MASMTNTTSTTTAMTSQQQQMLSIALTEVYNAALVMVQTLAQMRQNFTGRVPAVKKFQVAWNANLDALRVFVGEGAEGIFARILVDGLDTDSRYGQDTATALGGLIYLIGEQFTQLAASTPISPANIPTWWAQNHALITGALMTDFQPVNSSPNDNADVELNPGEMAQDTLQQVQTTQQEQTSQNDSESVMTFDDSEATAIQSTARRSGWSVPIWSLGIGFVTLGGLWYAINRNKKARVTV